jgi:two-component system chemotaxis response regulator CheB
MAPPRRDQRATAVVALAASAGGLAALRIVLGALPADLPAAVLVVQHLDPAMPSLLAHILQRHAAIPVVEAVDGTRLEHGHVYIAPPAHHLTVSSDGCVLLTDTPRRHWVRPSADELFESVAREFEGHAVAVVLTGTGKDGAEGTQAVQGGGGTVFVQDPATSQFSGMPLAAIRAGAVSRVVPLEDIADALVELLGRPTAA